MGRIVLLAFFALIMDCAHGQAFGTMSDQDKENLKKQAIEKIKDLHFAFGHISDTKPAEGKDALIERLLSQFNPGAKIEVANRSGKRKYFIDIYLNEVLRKNYRKRYKLLNISFISFEMGDLRPDEKELGVYWLDYNFVQQFCASVAPAPPKSIELGPTEYDYCDITEKEGSFKIKKVIIPIRGSKWVLYYDDISVVDLKIL